MGSNRYGTVAASVTEQTEPLWLEFRTTARRLGMTKTRALERAVRLWLDSLGAPDQPPPAMRTTPDPFFAPPPAELGDTCPPTPSHNPFA